MKIESNFLGINLDINEEFEIMNPVMSDDYLKGYQKMAETDKRYKDSYKFIKPGLEIVMANESPSICCFEDGKGRIFQFMKPVDNELLEAVNVAILEGLSLDLIPQFTEKFFDSYEIDLESEIKSEDHKYEVYASLWALGGVCEYCNLTDKSDKNALINFMKLEELIVNPNNFHSEIMSLESLEFAKSIYIPTFSNSNFGTNYN
jgi:hypothetical protein